MRQLSRLLVLTALASGCGLLLDADERPDDGGPRDTGVRDGIVDANADAVLDADSGPDAGCVWGPWESAEVISEVSSTPDDWSPAPSADNLALFFDSWRSGRGAQNDLYVSTRASPTDTWGMPVGLEELNTDAIDGAPAALSDGLTLYFGSNRSGSEAVDIWKATRPTIDDRFSSPDRVPGINSPADDTSPHVTPDGQRIYFSSNRDGSTDVFVAVRTAPDVPFTVSRLDSLSIEGASDSSPTASADETEIFFSSDRPGGRGGRDIYYATRPDRFSDFSAPTNLGELFNGVDDDTHPALSTDGRTLYFVRDACVDGSCDSRADIWKAERDCLP